MQKEGASGALFFAQFPRYDDLIATLAFIPR